MNPSSLNRIGPLTFREDRSFIICSGTENFRVFYFQKRKREWPGKTSLFFHRLFNVAKSPLTFHQSHRTLYLIAASFTQQHPPSHNRLAWRVLMLQKFPLPSMVKLFWSLQGKSFCQRMKSVSKQASPNSSCQQPASAHSHITEQLQATRCGWGLPPCLLCRRPSRNFLL